MRREKGLQEMTGGPSSAHLEKSETWLRKGMATIVRMARGGAALAPQDGANPLRDLFTDLMAYVIFFEGACTHEPPPLNDLQEKITSLVNTQEERAKTIGVATEVFREARFAVLSWVDEMIMNSDWPHRAHWKHLMLKYYGTLNAGEEFFRHLELLPSEADNVREIYYLCLALGFEGRYAFGEERRELKDIKQRLYKQLCGGGGDIRQHYPRLFPEAYQKATASPQAAPQWKGIWYVAAVSVPILLFAGYWFFLWQKTNGILAMLDKPTLAPSQPDWRTSLLDELRKKKFPAVDYTDKITITLESLQFELGSARPSNEAKERIKDIVATVRRYAPDKFIEIEGHTSFEPGDNEDRNRQLSLDRARAVADEFVQAGFQQSRIVAAGKGSSEPVVNNLDANLRYKNRRVEIIIKK